MGVLTDNTGMKKLSQKILIFLLALTLVFIWVNSMLPGDLSSMESGWVQKLLGPLLDFIYSGRIQATLRLLADQLPERLRTWVLLLYTQLNDHILSLSPTVLVRKAAHFSEYTLLGLLMGLQFVRRDGRSRFFLPETLCLAVALIDESIQLFSTGRAAQLRDVCIDLSGATLGLTIALTLLSVLRFWHRNTPGIGKFS